MAWTASKIDKGFSNGFAFVRVLYTDGVSAFEKGYETTAITADWPDALVRTRLAELNAIDLTTLKTGTLDPAPVIAPQSPTQAELDRAEWFRKHHELERKGLYRPPTDLELLALKDFLSKNEKPEYFI